MAPKTPILIIAGLSGLAIVTGVTSAVIQSTAPQPQSSVVTASPTVTSPSTVLNPTTVPIAPQADIPNTTPTPAAPVVPPAPAKSVEPPASPPNEASREIESCKISMAKVNDPNPPLNVRSEPGTSSDTPLLGRLKNGTFVTVVSEKGDWFQISTPLKGWIAKTNADSHCNEKVERVGFAAGGSSATITDYFIGTGLHKYRFNLARGQTLILTSNRGPLPAIVSPDGKFLGGMHDDQEVWSGQLPTTGDYTLQMESNFKGYKYSFLVQVK